jgi:GNAT superfamily N-acetyltransferase
MMIEVRQISPEETRELRHQVLWPHINRMEDCVIEIDHREDAFHLGAYIGGDLAAIGSFFQMETTKLALHPQYRLRAMASHTNYRGSGAGKQLVMHGLDILRQRGIAVLWCDARLKATGFYASLGFQWMEEIYDVPSIGPHQFMWFTL